MLAEIEKLKEVSQRCLDGEALNQDLAQWLGSALQGFLKRQHRTMEEALGLRFPQGGVPWWREEAIRKRDAALRDLADGFFADLSPCAQAQRILVIAIRYAASAWRFDCNRDRIPDHYQGKSEEYLWLAFTSGAVMPPCERQLRRILAR